MSLSLFVLALWVFLQSAATYNWFSVDAKLIAFVGIVFVVIVVVEAVLIGTGRMPRFLSRRGE
jgi:hypothetical protein